MAFNIGKNMEMKKVIFLRLMPKTCRRDWRRGEKEERKQLKWLEPGDVGSSQTKYRDNAKRGIY